MGSTTMGVKLDEATRDRIKGAAQRIDRTPHWLIKQAIFNYLERLENGSVLPELPTTHVTPIAEADDIMPQVTESAHQPFLDFAEQVLPHVLRSTQPRSRPAPCARTAQRPASLGKAPICCKVENACTLPTTGLATSCRPRARANSF